MEVAAKETSTVSGAEEEQAKVKSAGEVAGETGVPDSGRSQSDQSPGQHDQASEGGEASPHQPQSGK